MKYLILISTLSLTITYSQSSINHDEKFWFEGTYSANQENEDTWFLLTDINENLH